MNILGSLCVVLSIGFPWNVVVSTKWVDDVIKYIVVESEFKQVQLMTRLDGDEIFENPLIEKIFFEVTKMKTTMRINVNKNFELPGNSVPDEATGSRTLIDTSGTLFLLAIESHDSLPIPMAKRFIDAVAEMATYHYSPKYLMVSASHSKASEHLEELVTYAWSENKLLDFTIIELITIPRYGNATTFPMTLPTIHRLNPFKKEYTTEKWTRGMKELFPNKLTDMSGYPLKVPGIDGITSILGDFLLRRIAKKFNCSLKYCEDISPDMVFSDFNGLLDETELHNIDIIPWEFPLHSSIWKKMQPTVPVTMDEMCILVPILTTKEAVSVMSNLLKAYFLSFGIVLIFWIFMRLLRFSTYPWRIFNIGRVLFGVPIRQQPRGNVERIVFTCLLAIFAGYSSTIYTGIVDITWKQLESEVPFESFEDLVKSGLTLQVVDSDLDRLDHVLEGPLSAMKNRTVRIDSPIECGLRLAEDRNFTCLMRRSWAESIIKATTDDDGRARSKLAEPCLWNEAYAYPLRKRSPYRASFDKLIGRMQSFGLFEKEMSRNTPSWEENDEIIRKPEEEINNLPRQLIVLVLMGYSLSIFVFLCEIIYYRLSTYMKSKKRPPPPAPFPFVL